MLARRAPAVTARLREQRGLETEAADRHPARRRRHSTPSARASRSWKRARPSTPARSGSRPRSTGSPRPPARPSDLQAFYREVHATVGDADVRRELLHRPLRRPAQGDQLPVLRGLGRPRHSRPATCGSRSASATPGASTAYVLRTGRPDDHQPGAARRARSRRARSSTSAWSARATGWGLPSRPTARRSASSSARPTRTCTTRDADRELLAFVGQHIGSALSRVRAIEETRQRNDELALDQRDRRGAREAARLRFDRRTRRQANLDDVHRHSMYVSIYDRARA